MTESKENPVSRRERSARYPSVPLQDAIAFCRQIDELGIDGLGATQIATAMGYRNVKTNTFSGRLSSARQFQLIVLNDQNYSLTELALRIIHPIEPAEVPQLNRQACLAPHLYAELIRHYAGKRLPEAEILGNLLMHKYQITASAKAAAAEAFLESLRFVGLMNDQRLVETGSTGPDPSFGLTDSRFTGATVPPIPTRSLSETEPVGKSTAGAPAAFRGQATPKPRQENEVRLDLTLWDTDQGKRIRLRAPSTVTRSSMDRFLESLRLAVRVIDDPVIPTSDEMPEAGNLDDDSD
jgi:hypothetical protein